MLEGTEPFFLKPKSKNNKKVGVLLFHGWTSSPYELRKLGNFLEDKGFAVYAPLLSGHGTKWQDLYNVGWKDWEKGAERAYQEISKEYENIFVGGVSMGGNLAIHLAAKHSEIKGLIMLGTPIRLKKFFLRKFLPVLKIVHPITNKSYSNYARREILDNKRHYWTFPTKSVSDAIDGMYDSKRKLKKVKCHTLVMQSTKDQLLTPINARIIFNLLGTDKDKKELVWIKDSDHTFIVDIYKDQIFEKVYEFISHNL